MDAAIEVLRRGERCEESARILHDAYHKRFHRYFLSHGCSAEDARDLTQDTFLKIYRGIRTFHGDSAFSTWAWAIARNVLLKFKAGKPAEEESPEDLPPKLEPVADEPDPVVVIGRRQLEALVLRSFERLPARQRQCMVLRYVHGQSYEQVATVMNISINSVKAHLHQGRTRLKELLANAGDKAPGEPR